MKNIKLIFSTFILFSLLVFTIGCQKDELIQKGELKSENVFKANTNSLPSIFELIALRENITEADGLIFIKNQNKTSIVKGQVVSDGYYSTQGEFIQNDALKMFGKLSVDNIEVPKSRYSDRYLLDYGGIRNTFGNTVKVSLADDKDPKKVLFSTEMYNPAAIEMLSPVDSHDNDNLTTIRAGEVIKWNEDPRNGKGVYIGVFFDLRNKLNLKFQGGKYKSIGKLLESKDDGSHTLSKYDLRGIPEGAALDVIIARANYAEIAFNNDQEGLIFGLTVSPNTYRYTYE